MNKAEIEYCLNDIMSECEIFTDKNPLTYLIFLDRYKHQLTPIQINNVNEIIENLKAEMFAYQDMNLRKFDNPLCSVPLDKRGEYFEEHKDELCETYK